MKLENYFKNGKVYVWKGTYAIVIRNNENIIKIDKHWKILTLDIVFPLITPTLNS